MRNNGFVAEFARLSFAAILLIVPMEAQAVNVALVQDASTSSDFTTGYSVTTTDMSNYTDNEAAGSIISNYVGNVTWGGSYTNWVNQAALKFSLPATASVLSTANLHLRVIDIQGSAKTTVTLTDDNAWQQADDWSTSTYPSLLNEVVLLSDYNVASTGDLYFALATADLDTKIVPGGTTTVTLVLTGNSATDNYFNFVADDDASTDQAYLVLTFKPQVQSVSVPANGTYKSGDALNFTVTFDSAVTVTGTPRIPLTLNTGGTVYASFVSGSTTNNLVFRHTVLSGELDADGIALGSAISLNSGTIKSGNGDDAELNLYSVAATTGVLVDGVAPTISGGVTTPSSSTYAAGGNLDYTVNFSENVTVTTTGGTPYLTLTIGSSTAQAVYLSGSGTSAIKFRYTVASGNIDADGVALASDVTLNGGAIKDAAGNAATLTFTGGTSAAVLVDGVAPTISGGVTAPSANTYGAGDNLDYTVNFSENVTVTTTGGTPYLNLTIGGSTVQAAYLSGSGTSAIKFRYTVASGDLDADGVALASNVALNGGTLKDAAGNDATMTFSGSTATDVLVDGRTAQTITFGSLPTQTYGATALKLTASSTSGSTISYASSNAAVARISNDTAYLLKADTATITASQAGNGTYKAATSVAQKLTIDKKVVSVTADAKTKVYGSSDPALTYTSSGLVGGDALTGDLVRASGDTVGSYAIGQGDVSAGGNYAISYTGANLAITKKTLTITGATASNKVYDGTTSATVTGISLPDIVGSDDVTLTGGTATFATKDTGTAKVVTASGYTLSGTKAGNYLLAGQPTGLSATITPKTLSVTAAAKTKVYGSADPALTYTSSGLVGGDAITGDLARASGETVGSYAIGQGDVSAGGNYTISYTGANLAITKKTLTITGATASNKVYDGETSATVTGASLSGVENADDVALVLGTATFASKDTGTAKAVTVNGSSLTGTKSGNYSLSEATGLVASITPKTLSVTADAKTKVYGSGDPALTYASSGLVGGDAITGGLARASGETVGSYAIGQGTVSAGGNYTIAFTGANLAITRKTLTITGATASNKVYDGTTSATVTGASLSGVENADDVTLTGGTASFASKDTGTAKAVTASGYALSGTKSGNYLLAGQPAGLAADITPATLTITAADTSAAYGAADPQFRAIISGLVNGEKDTVVKGLQLSRNGGTSSGDYVITPSGATAANYAISYVNGKFTIDLPFNSVARMPSRAISTKLEARVPKSFAKPSYGNADGRIALSRQECDDGSCQFVDVLMPQAGEIVVMIFDNMGTPVIRWNTRLEERDLWQLPPTDDGRRQARLTWNLHTDNGRAVGEGVYLWRVVIRLKDGTKLEEIHRLGVRTER